MMRIHQLKCWPQYFDAIVSGEKTFEVRRDDRGFQRGDVIELQKCGENSLGYDVMRDLDGNPRHVARYRIGWILTGGQFGIEPGYVVFSLQALDAQQPADREGKKP